MLLARKQPCYLRHGARIGDLAHKEDEGVRTRVLGRSDVHRQQVTFDYVAKHVVAVGPGRTWG